MVNAWVELLLLLHCTAVTVSQNCSDGAVEIFGVETDTLIAGRLEICVNGSWHAVYDEGWGDIEAEIVCSSKGFPIEGALPCISSCFGESNLTQGFSEFSCFDDMQLIDCGSISNFTTTNAGVICSRQDTPTTRQDTPTTPTTRQDTPTTPTTRQDTPTTPTTRQDTPTTPTTRQDTPTTPTTTCPQVTCPTPLPQTPPTSCPTAPPTSCNCNDGSTSTEGQSTLETDQDNREDGCLKSQESTLAIVVSLAILSAFLIVILVGVAIKWVRYMCLKFKNKTAKAMQDEGDEDDMHINPVFGQAANSYYTAPRADNKRPLLPKKVTPYSVRPLIDTPSPLDMKPNPSYNKGISTLLSPTQDEATPTPRLPSLIRAGAIPMPHLPPLTKAMSEATPTSHQRSLTGAGTTSRPHLPPLTKATPMPHPRSPTGDGAPSKPHPIPLTKASSIQSPPPNYPPPTPHIRPSIEVQYSVPWGNDNSHKFWEKDYRHN